MIRVINKTTCRLGCGAAAVVEVCVVDLGRVCVEGRGANGACRVSCMLIAWTGALVNSSNVFSGIKGSKLRVLKELVTIDFERRAASWVHYMGALSLYFRQRGHFTNNRELGVSIPLLFRTKISFNHSLFLHSRAIKYKTMANEYYPNDLRPWGFFCN